MMNTRRQGGFRKSGRFGSRPPSSRPPGRRQPPPEVTGEESRYLAAIVERGAAVSLALRDGSTVAGRLLGFDRQTLRLVPADGGELVLRRSEVRWLAEPR
ncbi:MAG TPA: hypothetical protein VJS92_11445 [Candidatus Polarisedimenticolaceae bacterium]|nr:hypothetical protein [Candidatus Polarisedimenticolaceae bacterium]